MKTHIVSFILFVGTVTLMSGQTPTALQPQQRAKLYKQNRIVIERLIEKTVTSSRTPKDHLKRAESYYKLLFQFNMEISDARDKKDQRRVEELTHHLKTLVDQGLAPTLEDARKQVEGGTGAADFPNVKDQLLSQLDALLDTITDDPKTKTSLSDLRTRLMNHQLKK